MASEKTGPSFLDKFAEVSAKVGNQVHLRSLRDAFATVSPIYILAGVAVLINNVLFPWIFGGDAETLAKFQTWGASIAQGTLSFSAVILAGIIGYCLARNKRFDNAISCVVIGLASLIIMMPQTIVATAGAALHAASAVDKTAAPLTVPMKDLILNFPPNYAISGVDVTGVFSSSYTGTNGLFGAIIIGLLATTLFIKLSSVKRLKVNLGEGVPPAVADSFNTMIPMMLTLSVFALAAALLSVFFSTNLMALIATGISAPLKGLMNAGPFAVIIIYTFANLLFCLGIHQSTISGVLVEPILTMLIVDNMATFAAGQPIPQDHYMNMQIINTFALIGGSGCTLMLLFDTFLFSKNKASKDVAALSLLPGIFNINEPVIYGYPIVYNLPLIIPFVLVPDLFIGLTYLLTNLGLISPCVAMVPWTTPVFISGWLATAGDFRAVIWQVIEVVLAMAIYLPFMRISERVQAKQAEALKNTDSE